MNGETSGMGGNNVSANKESLALGGGHTTYT